MELRTPPQQSNLIVKNCELSPVHNHLGWGIQQNNIVNCLHIGSKNRLGSSSFAELCQAPDMKELVSKCAKPVP